MGGSRQKLFAASLEENRCAESPPLSSPPTSSVRAGRRALTVPTLISRGCGQTETAGAGKQPSLFHERHTAPASCPRAPHARNAKARADRGAMVCGLCGVRDDLKMDESSL